jgi:hypothetical protein
MLQWPIHSSSSISSVIMPDIHRHPPQRLLEWSSMSWVFLPSPSGIRRQASGVRHCRMEVVGVWNEIVSNTNVLNFSFILRLLSWTLSNCITHYTQSTIKNGQAHKLELCFILSTGTSTGLCNFHPSLPLNIEFHPPSVRKIIQEYFITKYFVFYSEYLYDCTKNMDASLQLAKANPLSVRIVQHLLYYSSNITGQLAPFIHRDRQLPFLTCRDQFKAYWTTVTFVLWQPALCHTNNT